MKTLLTSKTGQVGYEQERRLQGLDEITVHDRDQNGSRENLTQCMNEINCFAHIGTMISH
jgi:hypothetical protein